MSVDRTTLIGFQGRSRVRCDGYVDGHRCTTDVLGAVRGGVRDARATAKNSGWNVAVRVQWAPNGSDLRDYCPEHAEQAEGQPG